MQQIHLATGYEKMLTKNGDNYVSTMVDNKYYIWPDATKMHGRLDH